MQFVRITQRRIMYDIGGHRVKTEVMGNVAVDHFQRNAAFGYCDLLIIGSQRHENLCLR